MMAAKAMASMPHFGRIDDESTSNIGIIHGGGRNIVCDACTIAEKYAAEKDRIDSLTNEIWSILRKLQRKWSTTRIEVETEYPGFIIDENTHYRAS